MLERREWLAFVSASGVSLLVPNNDVAAASKALSDPASDITYVHCPWCLCKPTFHKAVAIWYSAKQTGVGSRLCLPCFRFYIQLLRDGWNHRRAAELASVLRRQGYVLKANVKSPTGMEFVCPQGNVIVSFPGEQELLD